MRTRRASIGGQTIQAEGVLCINTTVGDLALAREPPGLKQSMGEKGRGVSYIRCNEQYDLRAGHRKACCAPGTLRMTEIYNGG